MNQVSLGRGLAALLGDTSSTSSEELNSLSIQNVDIHLLRSGRFQPRKIFLEDELADLTRSILEQGVLLPILVRPQDSKGTYEIIAGERRWRASLKAHQKTVPILIKDFSNEQCYEIALVENIQRSDLSPIEEAHGFKVLIKNYGHTQEMVAQTVGKSRSYISNTLRLLELPEKVQDLISSRKLSAGHARTLLSSQNPLKDALEMIEKNMSVRQAEEMSRTKYHPSEGFERDPDLGLIESRLSTFFGGRVLLKPGKKQTELRVFFDHMGALDVLIEKISDLEVSS